MSRENDKVYIGEQMVDVTAPEIVQIQIRADGKVLWINVDGVCRLRCCQITNLVINDERTIQ